MSSGLINNDSLSSPAGLPLLLAEHNRLLDEVERLERVRADLLADLSLSARAMQRCDCGACQSPELWRRVCATLAGNGGLVRG